MARIVAWLVTIASRVAAARIRASTSLPNRLPFRINLYCAHDSGAPPGLKIRERSMLKTVSFDQIPSSFC
jgi:hypothetical protein